VSTVKHTRLSKVDGGKWYCTRNRKELRSRSMTVGCVTSGYFVAVHQNNIFIEFKRRCTENLKVQ